MLNQSDLDTMRASAVAICAAWIAQDPAEIEIIRDGQPIAAQTVHIIADKDAGERRGENVSAGATAVIVVGHRNHKTIPDADIKHGDRFFYDDVMYRVEAVQQPGDYRRVKAFASALPE